MSQNITCRPFIAEDAEAVAVVARAAWAWTYAGIFAPATSAQFVATHYAPERLRALAPAVAASRLVFDLALDDETVVGFCNLGPSAAGAELYRIYLLPAYVRKGIGAALLARGEVFLRTQGFTTYHCFVHCANQRGQQFYARQGFHRMPQRDREDEWCLEKSLAELLSTAPEVSER
ncbi:MAG: GNAT family N-acetyltransferase [Chloroflexi bacterium OHK40]